MATLISMAAAKKVPLHMISGGTRRSFSSIENTCKKPTSVSYAYDSSRIATQIYYIAQKVEKIEQQLHQLQRDRPPQEEDENNFNPWKLNDTDRDGSDFGCNFSYVPPEYHDPKLPEFSAIAKRALDTYNLSQVTKLELVEVASAYTERGEDYTRIVIEAKPCNPATDINSQPQVIYQGTILSKEEKFEELKPVKPAKNLDKNDHQSEFPVDHPFALVARQAIHSYNLGQHDQDSKLELIKATSVTNKPCVVIEARTCNTPDSQPVIYKGLVSIWDKKVEELITMEPGELKL